MSATLLDRLGAELAALLEPLRFAVSSPRQMRGLLDALGAMSPEAAGGDALAAALRAVLDIRAEITDRAAHPIASLEGIGKLLEPSKRAWTAIAALDQGNGPARRLTGFGRDLADLLVTAYLRREHLVAFRIAVLLGLIEEAGERPPRGVVKDGVIVRRPHRIDWFHLDELADLLRDPRAALRTEYGGPPATIAAANRFADKLFPRISRLLEAFGVLSTYGFLADDAPLLGNVAPLMDHALIVYTTRRITGAEADAGAIFALSSADRGDLGLVVTPFGALAIKKQVAGWDLELDVAGGVTAFAVGPHGLTLPADTTRTSIATRFNAALPPPATGPAFVFGAATGTRLEVGGVELSVDLQLSETLRKLALAATVAKAALVVAPGDGDGVLARLLPAGGLRADFDLGLAWSNDRGLEIKGGAGLAATLPVHVTLGPLTIGTVRLALVASGQEVHFEAMCSASLSLGPVTASVDGIGLATKLAFPPTGGNLGVADLAIGFQPPKGIGLAVDAAAVKGGGFLLFDSQAHRYAGVLQLMLGGRFTLTGIGLIEPTATGKTSALIIATLELPPTSPSFSITGVGAVVALHRAGAPDELMKAVSTGELDAVLFPANPIARAGQIIATLGRFFPARDDHYLVGLLVQFVFGGKTLLIVGELGVLVELGHALSDLQVYLVLQARLAIPGPAQKAFRVNVEGFGHWDVGRGEFELRLQLRDSKVFGADLTGEGLVLYYRVDAGPAPVLGDGSDAFVDARVGHKQLFVSLGGYHPDYRPPPRAVVGQRLALTVKKGDWLSFEVQQYIALTPGAFHFGADANLLIKLDPLEVRGDLGFDALIGFDWSFDIAIHASMSVRVYGHELFGVAVEMSLIGPGPTVLKGKVSVSILWWDISKSFCKELSSEPAAVQAAPDVGQLLRDAVHRPDSWVDGTVDGIALAKRNRPATAIWASPTRPLRLAQTVVPLGVVIDRYGPAKLAQPRSFTIDRVRLGAPTASVESTTPVAGEFGRALYVDLADQEKLAATGFDALTAGFEVAGGALLLGPDVVSGADYEEIVVPRLPSQPPRRVPIGPQLLEAAKRLSPLAVPPAVVPRVVVQAPRFAVADAVDGKRRLLTDGTNGLPYTLARQAARLGRRAGYPLPSIIRLDEVAKVVA